VVGEYHATALPPLRTTILPFEEAAEAPDLATAIAIAADNARRLL